MAGINLGTIYAVLAIKDELTAQLNKTGSVIGRVAGELENFVGIVGRAGDAMQRTGVKLTVGVTAPITAVGAIALRTGVDFERAMNQVRAVLQPTAADFTRLKDKAIEMGKDTVFSATDSAQALLELGKAGLDVNESLESISPTLQLAAASGLTMARAAEISARAMRAFQMDTSDLPHLNDVLAKAVNASTLEIEDIATAFKYVGPIATSFGLSIEDVVASLAIMRDAGIAAETTGRGLREGMERMVNPVKNTKAVMAELGIETFMSGGQLMHFSDIIGMLESKGMTAAQSMLMFGDAAGPAMFALVQQGKAGLDGLVTSLQQSGGESQRMSEAMMSGVPGAIEQFKGSLETLKIVIANDLRPFFLTLLAIGEMALDFFTNLPAPIRLTIVAMLGLAAVAGPLLIVLGSLVKTLALMQTLAAVNTALNILSGATTKAAASSGLLSSTFATLTGWLTRLGQFLMPVVANIFSVNSVLGYLGSLVTGTIGLVAKFAGVLWSLVSALAGVAAANPVVWVIALVAAITSAVVWVLKFTGLWDPLMDVLNDVLRIAKNLVILGFEQIKSSLQDLASIIIGTFKSAWTELRSMFAGMLGVTEAQVVPAIKAIGLALAQSIPGLREMVAVVAYLKNNLPGAAKGIKGAADASDEMVRSMRSGGLSSIPMPPGYGQASFPTGLSPASIADRNLRKGSPLAAPEVDTAWRDFLDELSGRSAITEAQKWMRGLEAVGGVTKLTADTQARLNGILGDALEAYAALGIKAPAAMARVWASTLPTQKVIDGLHGLQDLLDPSKGIRPLFAMGPGVTDGLGGLDFSKMESVMPQMPKLPTFFSDAFGSAKDFGANLSGTIMQAITGGGSIVNAISGFLGTGAMTSVVKGFSASFASTFIGGALSSILPGLGALMGPLVEKLAGLFNKPEWKKITSGVGRDWGVDISENLAKAIESDSKRLNSRFAATLLHISDIVKEGGGVEKFGLEKTIAKTRDLFVEVGQKAITTKEAATAMGSIFPQIADVIVKSNKIASASFVELIALNKQFGLDTKEILDFVASQAGVASEGIVAMLGPLSAQKELTAESAMEFERMGILALASFNAAVTAGVDWLTAIQAIGPSLSALLEIQTNLGITTENAALAQLLHYQELVTANEQLVIAAGGLNTTMMALSNIGGLNIATLQALEAQGIATFDRLIAAGFSEAESLMMMKGFLENVILAHQQMGIPIDENTMKLITLAEQHGVLSEQQLSTNDILMQGFAALIEAVGGQLPEAFLKMRDAAVTAASGVTDAINNIPRDVPVYVHMDDGSVPSPDSTAETAARGGLVMANRVQHLAGGGLVAFQPRGTDTVAAMLTPGEGIVSVRGMSQLGEDGLAALNNGGGPGTTVRNSFVINNPVMDTDERVEQLASAVARRIYNGGAVRTEWSRALKGL